MEMQPAPAKLIADAALLAARTELEGRDTPFVAALGIATSEGMTFVELPSPVPRAVVRDQVWRLSKLDEIWGFAYVAASAASNDDTGEHGSVMIVSAITPHSGRICRLYAMQDDPDVPAPTGSAAARVSSEPKLESDCFMSWVFDGVWEVMQ